MSNAVPILSKNEKEFSYVDFVGFIVEKLKKKIEWKFITMRKQFGERLGNKRKNPLK